MDAPERVDGENTGPIPKPVVLAALSWCTGMDVVPILRKQGIELIGMSITVTEEISKSHPIEYVWANVKYDLKGADEGKIQAIDAVNRSQNELCGVSSMMKKAMPVTWLVIYNRKEVFNNVFKQLQKE